MKSRVNKQQLRTLEDIQRQREIMQVHIEHNTTILNRDLEVIKANLIGVKIVGELAKKAVSFIEDRLFDLGEDELLYGDKTDTPLQGAQPVEEVPAVDKQKD